MKKYKICVKLNPFDYKITKLKYYPFFPINNSNSYLVDFDRELNTYKCFKIIKIN